MGMFLTGLVVLAAAVPGWLSPHDPRHIYEPAELPPAVAAMQDRRGTALLGPSRMFPLGTDGTGRDVLSRTIYGARTSVLAAAVSVAIALGIGGTAGIWAGMNGGWTDQVLSRLLDVFMAIPPVLTAFLTALALGTGWLAVTAAVGVINIPFFFRLARGGAQQTMGREFVQASLALGAGRLHLIRRAILPALHGPLTAAITLGLGTAILEIAGLSFLGLAGEVDVPEWGAMLREGKDGLRSSLWPVLAPGTAISLTVLGFNQLGESLRAGYDRK